MESDTHGLVLAVLTLMACSQSASEPEPRALWDGLTSEPQPAADCTLSAIAAVFAEDPQVHVTLVKPFRKGDLLALNEDEAFLATIVSSDLCLVKLNVGPGNPGPVGAPSTSDGIGIEAWLPSASSWTHRIHVMGPGGFAGGPEISSPTRLGVHGDLRVFGEMAMREGAVVSTTDAGHVSRVEAGSFMTAMADASFVLTPDGKANVTLLKDFSSRAIHETTLKTKALARAYYGTAPKFSYYEGCSNGGRSGLKEAQAFPEDFDGILAGAPAINATHAALSMLYAQVVMLRELGRPLTPEQLALVSSAAVSACDSTLTGRHDGFVTDDAACRYDPTRDPSVLCAGDGGINSSLTCVTRREANVVNKIWYGPTADGSAPSPDVATGYETSLRPGQIHFGYARGTTLAGAMFAVADSFLGKPMPISIATSLAALLLEDPAIAAPDSWIPSERAKDGWMSLGYADFAEMERRAVRTNPEWNDLESGQPDLTQYRARSGKIIQYHGTADPVLPAQGSDMYYEAVARTMGGYAAVQDFYRYFPVPGLSHCIGIGSSNGRWGVSPFADPPLPQLVPDNAFYLKLIEWVEGSQAPETMRAASSTGLLERPLCAYPSRLRFAGGDPRNANSYTCD